MKLTYVILSFTCLLFTGCSSTYTIKDFSSKQKFYEDLNKSAKDKDVKIFTKGDSVITSDNGVRISNDSLIWLTNKSKKEIHSIPVGDIAKISYRSNLRGTISGFLIGTLSGAAIGGLTHIIPANENHPSFSPPYQEGEYNTLIAFIVGTVSGAVIGTIVGWILGYDYVFHF